MKTSIRFLLILICGILTACGDDDEPAYGLFHLTLGMEADADVAMGKGLPLGSEVNLIVSSEAGIPNEISSAIPYLYNIRYYNSQQ